MTTLNREQVLGLQMYAENLTNGSPSYVPSYYLLSLCRLALKGLSAEKHLVPALTFIRDSDVNNLTYEEQRYEDIREANKALAAYRRDAEAV